VAPSRGATSAFAAAGHRARASALHVPQLAAGSSGGAASLTRSRPGSAATPPSPPPASKTALAPARYEGRPAAAASSAHSGETSIFGVSLGPAARDSLILALLIFGLGALIFALLFIDRLGLGPRHPEWRRRVGRRWSRRVSAVHLLAGRLRARIEPAARRLPSARLATRLPAGRPLRRRL